ncbi:hypothetical protein ABTW76_06130 [Paenibacillus dendritiformis]
MNNKKAIEVIKSNYPPSQYSLLREALDLAIDTLQGINGKTNDGYHTFDELYYHRMILFSIICNQNKDKAWKSWKHHDGTMFDNYFIVGIETTEGHYTYHYHKDCWDLFKVGEMAYAPEWDGHKPEDVTRLLTLV